MIELRDVKKSYAVGGAEVDALAGVTLAVADGEFVSIVGDSGSGKTTLMNIIGCLDRPDSGEYYLDGRDMTSSDRARCDARGGGIGFVFQSFHLSPRLTAAENVELPLVYRGVRASERRAMAEEALAAVGLADRTGHMPSELSGGQQQRVAIARSLVTRPKLILADEPTGNLDPASGKAVLALLERENMRGVTVLLITHDASVAERAGRRITIRRGRIESDEAIRPSGR